MSSSSPDPSPLPVSSQWREPGTGDWHEILPNYEVLDFIRRGGMGAVYKARQKSLNREVAIKVLPPMAEDEGSMHFADRFKAEAQSMARLNHHGIVAVYDAGETPGGLLYFVMELVQGTDVSQMIRSSGKLPPEHVYAIVANVCDALARVLPFTGGITEMKDLRYHHLKAQDLVFGAHILNAAQRAGMSLGGASDGFLRAAADKTLRAADYGGYGDGYAVKSAIKPDEVFSANLSNNGQNWVGVAYETQLWEAVREAPIYRALIDMGVMEVEIPRGFNSIYIPTEGTDPTFYSLSEQNDLTSDEQLPITGKSSNLTATRRQLTPGFIGVRVSFSDIMEEDSLIPVLPFLRAKMESRANEIIEYLMLNGDTETGSTNINYDGSAVSGLVDAKGRGPVYTALDGFLKLALVTTSKNCG